MIDPTTSVAALLDLVARRDATVGELALAYWDRAVRLNPTYNAFAWLDEEFPARVASADRPRLPVGIKDVQSVGGQPNTKSSLLVVDDAPKAVSTPFVERVLDAGFDVLGRTASSELAASLTTESLRHGTTRNPWHPDATPSGSSGGSAVAVAMGMVPVATATDGAGSIRLPAVACNLVGCKVTRGLLPQVEAPWDWSSVDGFVTRTVADTATLLDLVAQPDPLAWVPPPPTPGPSLSAALDRPLAPQRVGLLARPPNGAPVDPLLASVLADAADVLADAGHELVELEPAAMRVAGLDGYRRAVAPVWSHLLDYDLTRPGHPSVVARLEAGQRVDGITFVRAVAALRAGVRETVRLWQDVDLVLTPLTAAPFPDHGVLLAEATRPVGERPASDAMRAFVDWVNVLGLPAVALPTHRDGRGVPCGIQLIGAPHTEATLLRLGAEFEDRHRWHEQLPPAPRAVPDPEARPDRA